MRYSTLSSILSAALLTLGCGSDGWWSGGSWSEDLLGPDSNQSEPPAHPDCPRERESHGWTVLTEGLKVNNPVRVTSPSLRVDACGQPTVAWVDVLKDSPFTYAENATAVQVQHWADGKWEPMGRQPVGSFPWTDVAVSLAWDLRHRPILAMADGTSRPTVLTYTHASSDLAGQLEQQLRPIDGEPSYHVNGLHLEVGADGEPRMAVSRSRVVPKYAEPPSATSSQEVYEHTSLGWSRSADLTTLLPRTLRVDPESRPVFLQGSQLMRREDGVVRPVGPPLPESYGKELELTSDGRPVVLVPSNPSLSEMHFELLELSDAGTWVALTAPLDLRQGVLLGGAQFRLEPGTDLPVIAWGEYGNALPDSFAIRVMRWNGGEWEPIGDGPDAHTGGGSVGEVLLELDSEGRPTVAWMTSPDPAVGVMRYRP